MNPLMIPILAIVFALGVPSVALATHLVLRPMVRDIANAIRAPKEDAETARRLVRLEERFNELEQNVTRLVEAEDFRRQLESGRGERRP